MAEEPLEVLVKAPGTSPALLTTTVRTPGEDTALAAGIVVSEGVASPEAIAGVSLCPPPRSGLEAYRQATVVVRTPVTLPTPTRVRTSSCGWCGTDDLAERLAVAPRPASPTTIELEVLFELCTLLDERAHRFALTHGSHAALIARGATPLTFGEDVGRHNALDKAIGSAVLARTDLTDSIVVLSGRVGFDLLAKAATIGATAIVALGAPSARAVRAAERSGLILAGVARTTELRLYTGEERVSGLRDAPIPHVLVPER